MKKLLLPACVSVLLMASVWCLAQGPKSGEYVGTIKGTIPIRMTLKVEGQRVTGTYYYEKYKKPIQLTGAVGADGTVLLMEYDGKGAETGRFEGSFSPNGAFSGSWSSPDRSKEMPFSVRPSDGAASTLDPTGSYSTKNGSLAVRLLAGGKVKIHLVVVQGPGAHIGEVDAELNLLGDVAVYSSGACEITFRFKPDSALVEQKGTDSDCDFGAFVTVAGTYKRKAGKPVP
jgi:hypothetical protein